MISPEEAIELIEKNVACLKPKQLSLKKTMSLILAEDVFASFPMPAFNVSAMDGYAVTQTDELRFNLVAEIKAGDDAAKIHLKKGEAARIFTGAMIPKNTYAVVMQEKVKREGNEIALQETPKPEQNIRKKGEELKKGECLLQKGFKMNAAAVALLASFGMKQLWVYPTPRIGIIISGNELVEAGKKRRQGQIYESNGIMLKSLCKQWGCEISGFELVADDLKATEKAIKKLLKKSDMLLVSGGISVGDYDYVLPAMQNNQVQSVFYKIRQKPGKPLYLGIKNNKVVFALPGNPASALTCFYVYVLPALKKMAGNESSLQNVVSATLATHFDNKTSDKTLFIKAIVEGGQAHILDKQSSAMLSSFALANALVKIPEGKTKLSKGEKVAVLLLNK